MRERDQEIAAAYFWLQDELLSPEQDGHVVTVLIIDSDGHCRLGSFDLDSRRGFGVEHWSILVSSFESTEIPFFFRLTLPPITSKMVGFSKLEICDEETLERFPS